MTPQARLSAGIEILDQIILAAKENGPSGDKAVALYFKTRRYAGSKDRRAVRELVWQGVRRFGNCPDSGRAVFVALADNDSELADLFTGEGHAPALITADEPRAQGGILPDWIAPLLAKPEGGINADLLLDRAPLDVRVNALKADRIDLISRWPDASPLPDVAQGMRLPTGMMVETHEDYVSGNIEIQDYGSQLIAAACQAGSGHIVLDLCAGAGGKTLALAATMGGEGRLIAADTSRARLSELPKRAERAGATIETRLLNGGQEVEELSDLAGQCDVVLIDAPCSGTGTWRRNPETRWRLTADRLQSLLDTQAMLLNIGAALVKPGGALVYAVCALTEAEGAAQVAAMLNRHSDFKADDVSFGAGRSYGAGRILTPCHDESDGFYLARLKKIG